MLYVPLVGCPSLTISIQLLIAKRIILTRLRGASKVRIQIHIHQIRKCKSSLGRPSLPKSGYSSRYTVVPPHDIKIFPIFFKNETTTQTTHTPPPPATHHFCVPNSFRLTASASGPSSHVHPQTLQGRDSRHTLYLLVFYVVYLCTYLWCNIYVYIPHLSLSPFFHFID